MPRQFIAKLLDRDSADRAYTLAQLSASELGLEEWRRFVANGAGTPASEGGVLAIQNRSGIMQGLCSYRFEESLGRGKVCSVENLVALDLLDNACVASALLQALEDLARRGGASALRLDLVGKSPAGDRLIARLHDRGHRQEAIRLVKDLGIAESRSARP
jgi:hypothetical protein